MKGLPLHPNYMLLIFSHHQCSQETSKGALKRLMSTTTRLNVQKQEGMPVAHPHDNARTSGSSGEKASYNKIWGVTGRGR